jgi:2'-5' RNA ligase
MIGPVDVRERESFEQRWLDYQKIDRLREHWYWRPGWRIGRSFFTWHVTFDGQPELQERVKRLQAELNLPGLDLVPLNGLHLTMQGLGFTDEVAGSDVSAIVEAARRACRTIAPLTLALGPIDPDPEGIGLLVSPWKPVEELRHTLRAAIGSVWDEVPEPAKGFRPHVTLAYSATTAAAEPIRARLKPLRDLPPTVVKIDGAQLIALNRDHRVYQWEVVATVELGAEQSVKGTEPGPG